MCATLWRDASAGSSRAHECYVLQGLPGRRLRQRCRSARRYFGAESLQNATANGDTRTICFHHIHLKEDTTITFKVNGKYDQAALKKVNHALRDWRTGNPTDMDPHLIDALWEVYRETGAKEPIHVIGGYRSPGHQRHAPPPFSGVAKFSQHMLGKALDFYIPDVPLESSATPACASSAAASASTPLPARPSSTWTSAACGTGRGCRKRSSPASCPRRRRPAGRQQPGGAEVEDQGPDRRRGAQCARRGRGCRGRRHPARAAWTRDRLGRAAAAAAETWRGSVPMPKSRPGAIAAEPAPSGFDLASASSQPVRCRRGSRVNRARSRGAAPEAAPSGGFNWPRPRRSRFRRRRVRRRPQACPRHSRRTTSSTSAATGRAWPTRRRGRSRRRIFREARTAALAEAPITGSVARGSLAPWPMPDRAPARDAHGLCVAAASRSRPVRARPLRPASSPSSQARRSGDGTGTTKPGRAPGPRPASRSASASTIRGCAR